MSEIPNDQTASSTDEASKGNAGPPAQNGDSNGASRQRQRQSEDARQKRRPVVIRIAIAVGALLVVGGLVYWWMTRDQESTDDAYTDGRAISIAPEVSGAVVSLDVNDNQFVKTGDPLIHIDPRQYKIDFEQAEGELATAKAQYEAQQLGAAIGRKNFPAQYQQAQAQLENARANLFKAQADFDRQKSLSRPATSQQEVDAATAALEQAKAQVALAEAQVMENSPVQQRIGQTDAQVNQLQGQVEQAQAKLDQAKLNLSKTVVYAPQDGWITKRNVEKGNYVTPGQQIFYIVSPQVWVTANFKESQLAYMRPGQKVRIGIDAYPDLDLHGHVDSIQLGSGSKFTAFPPENATGNFVKIVQRVPVKIVIDSGLDPNIPMPLGISAVPTVSLK